MPRRGEATPNQIAPIHLLRGPPQKAPTRAAGTLDRNTRKNAPTRPCVGNVRPKNNGNRTKTGPSDKHRLVTPAAPTKPARPPCLIALRSGMGFPQTGPQGRSQPPRFRKSLTLRHESETHRENRLPG